jgi:RNA polymerase sigma-70 factor (ECF subfamily)
MSTEPGDQSAGLPAANLAPATLGELLAAVAAGDQAAFERIYVATRANLFGVVIRILRRQERAEAVMQEAYLKIWRSAGQYKPTLASPLTWMVTIARNRAIDEVRRAGGTETDADFVDTAEAPDAGARKEMTAELKRLLECVGQLDSDRQRLVLLAYYNGWSREQLAAKLDQPIGTIKSWLRRSMIEIRECLGA